MPELTDPREKAKDTTTSLLGLTMAPCLADRLGDELSDEQLDDLGTRISDAVTDEIATTLREERDGDV